MRIERQYAAKLLSEHDNIVIFTHRKPDGDAIGSSFALLYGLEKMGKKARIECADPIPHGRFVNIFGEYTPAEFEAEYLVCVDVADTGLLADVDAPYQRQIDLCVDHHKSNSFFAAHTLLDCTAAATAEMIYALLGELGVAMDKKIADAVFTGVVTDTGCFRYANTTPQTHTVAAGAMQYGADSAFINKLLFETKSRGRLNVDKLVLETMEYYFDGRCAVIYLEEGLAERFGVTEEELDGISALPRTVEGVAAGVTIRAKANGEHRVSLRTQSTVDASKICAALGGGGHANAAGCNLTGTLENVKSQILNAIEKELINPSI